jgi:hypothetical protein
MDILELLNKGAATAESLNDTVCLQKAAEQFLGAYAAFDGYDVVAASSVAERVLGAAMMLRPELSSAGRGRTVVFDVNIASGTLMARTAQRLRHAGNSDELVGIALHSLIDCGGPTSEVLGEFVQLIVAHPADNKSEGKCCDGRDHRVGLSI